MAITQRQGRRMPLASDHIYVAHAEEARAAISAAANDEVREHLDRSATAHDTAARLLAHAARCSARAARARASSAQAERLRLPDLKQMADKEATEQEAAAAAARQHADRWHAEGHQHMENA